LKKSLKKKWIVWVIIVACVLVAGVFLWRHFSEIKLAEEKAGLPPPQAANNTESGVMNNKLWTKTEISETQTVIQTPIPEELNLDMPFTTQAPSANWDATHEEACEEAAVLMAGRYFEGRGISGDVDAEAGLQEIIDWENKNLGFFESTTAEETARVIEKIYSLKTKIIENPTANQIKQAIADGKLVLVPAAGRELGNPFYKSPGPLYHMLLIKGYTPTQFITNDAGTRRGENYPYKIETILVANHDWNGGDVMGGARRVIVAGK